MIKLFMKTCGPYLAIMIEVKWLAEFLLKLASGVAGVTGCLSIRASGNRHALIPTSSRSEGSGMSWCDKVATLDLVIDL